MGETEVVVAAVAVEVAVVEGVVGPGREKTIVKCFLTSVSSYPLFTVNII